MFRLRTGYLISGIATGVMILFSFLNSLPDGKLHMVFCNVGQGDAAYIRFPDGRDALIDGGPNNSVLACLGRHMPFWDRTLDLVILTHPEKDHMNGVISVLSRYNVISLVRSDVSAGTEGFTKFEDIIRQKRIPVKLASRGLTMRVGSVSLFTIWPSSEYIARIKQDNSSVGYISSVSPRVLGATITNLNDASVVLHLRYGLFDAFLPGDADAEVDPGILSGMPVIPDGLEVLKVPHHGSKAGMTDSLISRLYTSTASGGGYLQSKNSSQPLAVVSVGKNSYGHPSSEMVAKLEKKGVRIVRTDLSGDIEIISDGRIWKVGTQKVTSSPTNL